MENNIRLGKISAVDYAAGTVRVVYHEKDDAVTAPIPLISSEYFMPEVDDMVMVLHLSNGTEAGVVLGRPWSEKNKPPEGSKGLYRKDLARSPGEAMIRYKDGTMTIKGFPGQPHPHGQHGRWNRRAIVRRRFTHDRNAGAQNHF